MGQVKNNDSFLGKAEKLKPVLKHRMLRPVGVVSFERKKADNGRISGIRWELSGWGSSPLCYRTSLSHIVGLSSHF